METKSWFKNIGAWCALWYQPPLKKTPPPLFRQSLSTVPKHQIFQWTPPPPKLKVFIVNQILIVIIEKNIFFFIWLTIKPNNLRKFYSRIFKEHIKTPSLWKGFYKISPVLFCICLCWSVMHFYQDLPSGFS